MAFLKFLIGAIGSIVAFVISVKILAILLALVGFALKLLWLAVVVGGFLLLVWLAFRIFSPRRAEHI
ncbi:MAG TPA: hypothetical protein VNH22_02885 [Blastocatellia bacterium]|jgi:threonine/homoserine/homoserine lactone efflux protein|nr:hypothetical protein [Blastocatellia bacterium]